VNDHEMDSSPKATVGHLVKPLNCRVSSVRRRSPEGSEILTRAVDCSPLERHTRDYRVSTRIPAILP